MGLHRVEHALEVEPADLREILAPLARLLMLLEKGVGSHVGSLELLELNAHAPATDIVTVKLASSALPGLERGATLLQQVLVIATDGSVG
jgi:hypothetical protein